MSKSKRLINQLVYYPYCHLHLFALYNGNGAYFLDVLQFYSWFEQSNLRIDYCMHNKTHATFMANNIQGIHEGVPNYGWK